MNTPKNFTQIQFESFNRAEEDRFVWQTAHPLIKEEERELLETVKHALEALRRDAHGTRPRVLEVGAGEGQNLVNLGLADQNAYEVYAVDYASPKVAFCQTQLPHATCLTAPAQSLPFPDHFFDMVFERDTLHHLEGEAAMKRALFEMHRILKPGGTLILIEPNGKWNLAIRLFCLVDKSEAQMKLFSKTFIEKLARPFGTPVTKHHAPSLMARVLFHFQYGKPQWAHFPLMQRAWNIWKQLMRPTPKWSWGYLVTIIKK